MDDMDNMEAMHGVEAAATPETERKEASEERSA